jgi:hypothetical protein
MQIDNVALGSMSMFGFAVTLAPAATAAASAVEQAFTLSGVPALLATDIVDVTGPGSGNNVCITGARINATGQLVIQFGNPTAGALTHAAGVFRVSITRF